MARTHIELVEEAKVPRWSSDGSIIHYGERFAGVVCGLVNDIFAECATTAVIAQYLKQEPGQPYEQPLDSIERLGQDALRPRYKGEHYINSAIPRIQDKWNFWTGSPKLGMIEEYEASGHVGVVVSVPGDFPSEPEPIGYWSRFWVFFPFGSHSIIGPGAVVGTAVVGTDVVGPEGLTTEQWGLIQSIANTYKDVQFVVWDYEFELGDDSIIRLQGKQRFADPEYIYHEEP
jgi:hypothetical protein